MSRHSVWKQIHSTIYRLRCKDRMPLARLCYARVYVSMKAVELEYWVASSRMPTIRRPGSASQRGIKDACRRPGTPGNSKLRPLAMMEIKGLMKQIRNLNYLWTRESHMEYQVSTK